jgi:hypothetical protein
MGKYGKCDKGVRILEDFVCQAIPGSAKAIGFKVGDRVRDRSGSMGTVLEIDTTAWPVKSASGSMMAVKMASRWKVARWRKWKSQESPSDINAK